MLPMLLDWCLVTWPSSTRVGNSVLCKPAHASALRWWQWQLGSVVEQPFLIFEWLDWQRQVPFGLNGHLAKLFPPQTSVKPCEAYIATPAGVKDKKS